VKIIRPTHRSDIPALQAVLDATDLFPSDMLPDMVRGFLSGDETGDLWLTCAVDDTAVGFCFARPEQLADGTWNMLAIAVNPEVQGRGYGRDIVAQLERDLAALGGRVLIADTSGTDAFAKTRAFYHRCGYVEEARIRDFWTAGDDKVVFWKRLSSVG
jgi:ribosomal protein S18 acetylase RimI-like enzyme